MALFAGLSIAVLWPPQVLSDDLKFADGAVRWLADHDVRVRAAARWTHGPWQDTSHAVALATNIGLVQAVALNRDDGADRLTITESLEENADSVRYRYRAVGLPGDPTWTSGYRWYYTRRGNWLLVTPDATVAKRLSFDNRTD